MHVLTLFARGFFEAQTAIPRLPVLETLFARGATRILANQDADDWLCGRHGLSASSGPPVAALTLFANGVDTRGDFCMVAEPAHADVARERLLFAPAGDLSLKAVESRGLADALDAHFSGDGLRFYYLSPNRWCVRGGPDRVSAGRRREAAAGDASALLPAGPDAAYWMRIVTEAQMLLHAHPLNAAREERGDPPINAVRLWGGGRLPRVAAAFDACVTDDPVTQALAALSGTPSRAPATALADTLRGVAAGHLLVCVSSPDGNTTSASLQSLERNWIAQAWAAARARVIERLEFACDAPAGVIECSVTGRTAWRVWRKPKPLDSLLRTAESAQ